MRLIQRDLEEMWMGRKANREMTDNTAKDRSAGQASGSEAKSE